MTAIISTSWLIGGDEPVTLTVIRLPENRMQVVMVTWTDCWALNGLYEDVHVLFQRSATAYLANLFCCRLRAKPSPSHLRRLHKAVNAVKEWSQQHETR